MPISPKGVAAGVAAAALLILGIDATTTTASGGSRSPAPVDRPAANQVERVGQHAISFRAGRRGQTVSPVGLWSTPVKPGLYEVTFTAMLWDQTAQGPANFICGVLDIATFGTDNQRIYVAASAPYFGGAPASVSGAATVRVRAGATPGAVCFPETGTFQFFKPLIVTYTKIGSREKRIAEPQSPALQLRSGANPFGTAG